MTAHAPRSLDPLALLVRELLLSRSEGLAPAQLAAFIQGWTSALELLARTDLTVPEVEPVVHAAVATLVGRVEAASREVLSEDEDDAAPE
ncbi:MAG: hypothetical protein IPH07_19845 [Deltaproteobacteria bacterium]|jgi:hypothetical protein|nr:hypothetical protein [Deltaproteobacteria bacterium]MBK8240052.1 hypothetical protein [Deltaproteobacteria bacterium]MBK8715959.1 hypothetical protein [Deltaproteobacteria bacterium]MBP7291868.1 hypothetical protein [Nannocystaceae bacterium]